MANTDRPAYQGKALSPGRQVSQGVQTAIRANQLDLPRNERPIPEDPQRPAGPSKTAPAVDVIQGGRSVKKPGPHPNVG